MNYYNVDVPLNQVATIAIENSRILTVIPWEKSMVGLIEKAIQSADLGLNPSTVGMVIRVPLPLLTEERRRELSRVVRNETEKARVAIRNIRREANHNLKKLLKEKKSAKTRNNEGKSTFRSSPMNKSWK